MTAPALVRFDDSEAYERFMGPWSRAVAPTFIEWLAVSDGMHWLDVGCGTGILTNVVLGSMNPKAVQAIDVAASQVTRAAQHLRGARFFIAEAEALPFRDNTFDVVASALVINFLRDRDAAVREMHRVTRDCGVVAGFVWNFADERSPSWPMRRALRMVGVQVPELPGTAASETDALEALFEAAGLKAICTRDFEVSMSYRTFDDYWVAQTPSYSPVTRTIYAMSEQEREKLKHALRSVLDVRNGEPFAYSVQANAIKAMAA
ncbi:MAG TPA: methyltransferase domain-containing protein [Casimicrobiaceae bacterium]|nr:methyltransferase domain-containing protein [Casimicrobiaceae bacterium]